MALLRAWAARLDGALGRLQRAAQQDAGAAHHRADCARDVRRYMQQCRASPTPLVPYEAALSWRRQQLAEYAPRSFLMTFDQMLGNPMMRQLYEPPSDGHQILRQMNADIDRMVQPPNEFQRPLIAFTMQLAAPRIYGREWRTNQTAIRRINNWPDINHGIGATITGRKEGKSTGLAMVTLIFLFNVPYMKVALFSKTKEQACIILGMAKEQLRGHGRASEFRIDSSAEVIRVEHLATGNVRVCTAYSGSADVSILFLEGVPPCVRFVACVQAFNETAGQSAGGPAARSRARWTRAPRCARRSGSARP
jgi:hypothetical protein